MQNHVEHLNENINYYKVNYVGRCHQLGVGRAVLTHGPNGHLPGGGGGNKHRGPTSIGAHANLCMLNTHK